jgi:hypothetical protein
MAATIAAAAGAVAPFGATTLGARAFGMAGEALLPSVLKGATTFGLLNAGDAAVRGEDAKDIVKSALIGAAGGVALPLAGKAVQAVAPLLAPIVNNYRGGTTAFATHEVHPGADTGHLPGSTGAPLDERVAYASDPRATFAKAPGGRDLIYGGLSFPDTGAVQVRPTNEMIGLYTPPSGVTEVNPGWAARPLVTLDQAAGTLTKRDRDLLNAAESYRAFVSGQNMGAWHTRWAGGPAKDSNSLLIPMSGKATPERLAKLQKATRSQGLPDISDTGQGITATNFGEPLPRDIGESLRSSTLFRDIQNALPGAKPQRVKVEASDNLDYVPAFREGDGSGAASRKMLTDVSVTPEIRAAMNNNPYIPQDALDRLALDQDWQPKWGVTREGFQNARRIVGDGPGWIDRIEAALKNGTILPAVAAAIFSAASRPDSRRGS